MWEVNRVDPQRDADAARRELSSLKPTLEALYEESPDCVMVRLYGSTYDGVRLSGCVRSRKLLTAAAAGPRSRCSTATGRLQ
jgi:hypothetical protein